MYLLIIAAVIVAIFLLDYLMKPKLDFPMPSFRLPIFGHMFFIGKKPQQKFEFWGAKCGSVYMIQVLNKTILVVNDNTIFQEICDTGNFEARNVSVRYNMLARAEKDGIPKDLFAQDASDHHQRLKRFTLDKVAKMRNSLFFNQLMTHTQDILSKEIQKDSVQNIVDPYEIVTRTIYNHYFCAANGALVSPDSPASLTIVKLSKVIRVCMSNAGKSLETFPWLKYFGNRTYKSLQEVNSAMAEVFHALKKEVDENGPNNGVTSGYLTDPDRPKESEDVLVSVLVNSLMGAAESAVTAFYGIIMLLAGHQEVQEKIRAEISSQRLSKPFVPAADCQSPYIEAVLIESLRYMAPVPMFIRRATKDTTITGKAVPKETYVLVNTYAGHHDASVWKDPWVFRPERFLDSNGNLLPESSSVRRNFKAFGASKKQCLGLPVVKDVLFSLIASLVDAFDMSAVGGIDIPYDSRSWVGLAVAAFPDRCAMKFTPRK